MKTTLKELEAKLKSEGKSGYAKIKLPTCLAVRTMRIGYFKDTADWHHISYENTEVDFIKYVGWEF